MTSDEIICTTTAGIEEHTLTPLGIVTASQFHERPERGSAQLLQLNSLTFEAELKAMRFEAAAMGADAIVGIQFSSTHLPGGIHFTVAGTACLATPRILRTSLPYWTGPAEGAETESTDKEA